MGDKTEIEWAEATWNPVVGCSIASAGCTHCYAMGQAARLEAMGVGKYVGLTTETKAGPVWNGNVRLEAGGLMQPLRWQRPRRIFVNSMSDLFHHTLTDNEIDRVFTIMALAHWHTFLIVTKRADRMREYLSAIATDRVRFTSWAAVGAGFARQVRREYEAPPRFPLPNVWLGVSVEDQRAADERIPELLATPAAVRFLSCEPLLGPVDVAWSLSRNPLDMAAGFLNRGYFAPGLETLRPLNWIIAGGESGPKARPMEIRWLYDLVSQCQSAEVPVFVKQIGRNPVVGGQTYTRPVSGSDRDQAIKHPKGANPEEWPEGLRIQQMPEAPHV